MSPSFLLFAACSVVPETPARGVPVEVPEIVEAAVAAPPPKPSALAVAALAHAEKLLGKPYQWGGRDTRKNPGVDCLGVLFLGYGAATGTSWTRYSVNPSTLVASGLLGEPVAGLDAVLRKDLDASRLVPGDVLYFLIANYEIPDAPVWRHEEVSYWPWHTGLYRGEGDILQAAPGEVVKVSRLEEMAFDALFVTRVEGP